MTFSLPGQEILEQGCFFFASPGQGFPPCLGVGFVQDRETNSTPLPQVTLHGIDIDQLDHPPLTGK